MKLFLPRGVFFVVIFMFVFSGKTVGQTTSGGAYVWSAATAWSPASVPINTSTVTVNSPLTLDQDLAISTGSYTFNQDVTDLPGLPAYNFSAVNASGSLTIASGTTTIGGVASIGGTSTFTLTVKSGATLILGTYGSTSDNFLIGNNVNITIESGGAIIVYGNIINSNSSGTFKIDGLLQVYGNYSTNNGNIDINGSGQFYTTGSMSTQGSGNIYGFKNDCTSNCSGTSLGCGTGGSAYTASITPSNQTVCFGSAPASLTFTTNAPSVTDYQWQYGSSAGGIFTDISGAKSNSYSPSALTTTTWYRMQYTSSASGCGTKYSAAVPVYVNGATYTQSTAGQTLCSGNFGPISVTAVGTNLTYQWYSNTSASNSGGTLISGAVSNVYTPSSAVGGTTYYYCVISSSSCETSFTTAVSGAFTVNLNTASAGSPSSSPCINTAMTAVSHTTTGATGIANDNVSGANGLPLGVSAHWAGNTITISGTPSQSGTFNYSIALTGGCGSVNATGTIIVNTVPNAPALSSIVLNCSDVSANETWTTVPNSTNYQFDLSLDPSFATFLAGYQNLSVAASASPSVSVSGLSAGETYNVRVRAVTACGTSLSSNVVTISVPLTTTTDGTTWSNGIPDATKKAVFSGTGTITLNSSITACSCQINSGANIVVGSSAAGALNDNAILKLDNGLRVDSGGSITFENNASLIQNNNSNGINTGKITYKRISTPMNNFDYTYWSSPVAGQTLKDLVPNTLPDKYFSFGTTYWVYEDGNSIMNPPGKGYIIRVPKPGLYPNSENVVMPYSEPVQFIGVPNNGSYTLPINTAGLYNLIGNPYPSALSADLFLKENCIDNPRLDGTIYFWTHNTQVSNTGYAATDYVSYNTLGGVGIKGTASGNLGVSNTAPLGNIAAGQSFFALSQNGGSVVFNNGMRVGASASNKQFFRGEKSKTAIIEKSRVWLNMTNDGGAFKQLLVGYITGATNGYDSAYDGESLDGNTFIDFYSILENKNLVIQGRALPFDTKDQVPLGYRTTIEGTFAISIDNIDSVLASQDIFIEDKQAKVIYNLKNGPYSFTTAKGTFNDRFVLRYDNTAAVVTTLDNPAFSESSKELVVSVKNHKIKINSFDETLDKVEVYDLRGSLLYQKTQVNGNEFTIPNFNSSNQFLIVMTQLTSGKWITKEIVF